MCFVYTEHHVSLPAGGEEAAGGRLLLHAASDHEEEPDSDDDDTSSETDAPAAPDAANATPDIPEDSPDSEERSLEWQVRNLAADNAKLKAKVQQLMMLQEENVQLREVGSAWVPWFPLLVSHARNVTACQYVTAVACFWMVKTHRGRLLASWQHCVAGSAWDIGATGRQPVTSWSIVGPRCYMLLAYLLA